MILLSLSLFLVSFLPSLDSFTLLPVHISLFFFISLSLPLREVEQRAVGESGKSNFNEKKASW